MDPADFYDGKKVLVTGHTGFKGSWMCRALKILGAEVVGISLNPSTEPNLYSIAEIDSIVHSIICDIRDFKHISRALCDFTPDIVIHMAAQPLVSVGYSDPVLTYSSNVMGTVNILEAIRSCPSVRSFVNVTTDKVYCNKEWVWGYRENEPLNGYDPYSNSKSCSELVTSCYNNCFFKGRVAISTARAGNVIGGGDFTNPRIIPDCVRAAMTGRTMVLRNPGSTRPYQHVLEPVFAYLMIAARQYHDVSISGSYNVGPLDEDSIDNETLVRVFAKLWGIDFKYEVRPNSDEPHEANFLKLDCSKVRNTFGWKPKWDITDAISKTIEWTHAYLNGKPIECMDSQIMEYLSDLKW